MRAIALFIKDKHGKPVKKRDAISLQRGYGIEGDVNAQMGSPRQVLITSETALLRFNLLPGDLGENFLVDSSIERFSSGQVLQIGQALIRLTFFCEPCAALENLQPGLSKRIKGQRGYLGIVVRDGLLKQFDEVIATNIRFPAIPNEPRGRFNEFVGRIPQGRVVKTADLLMALGVTKAHYRAIPAWLKRFTQDLPTHRIVRNDGSLMSEYVPHQAQLLRAEGVGISSNIIDNLNSYWSPVKFHELGGCK